MIGSVSHCIAESQFSDLRLKLKFATESAMKVVPSPRRMKTARSDIFVETWSEGVVAMQNTRIVSLAEQAQGPTPVVGADGYMPTPTRSCGRLLQRLQRWVGRLFAGHGRAFPPIPDYRWDARHERVRQPTTDGSLDWQGGQTEHDTRLALLKIHFLLHHSTMRLW